MEWWAQGNRGWADLPDHIVLTILGYLPRHDQLHAGLTCQRWMQIFSSPYNWRQHEFRFYLPLDNSHEAVVQMHGGHLRSVSILLDQYDAPNREQACQVIRKLAGCSERRLERLVVHCTGRNPLFYAGLEFVDALQFLFGPPGEDSVLVNTLKWVDLSGLPFLFDDALFRNLADHHPTLEYLNIQNSPLVCKVTPASMLHLVRQCRKLKDMRVLNRCISEDVLLALAEPYRIPLEHLAITCRREEKYTKDLSASAWKTVHEQLPRLRVTLRFDHTCPLHKIAHVLKPEIPCSVLQLETYTFIYDEIRQAAYNYATTLEKLVVQTRPSKELDDSILSVSDLCPRLSSLYVYCSLDVDTIESVFEKHPTMKSQGTYYLKHEDKNNNLCLDSVLRLDDFGN